MQKVQGFVENGNLVVTVGGVAAPQKVQGSYPQAQVAVYLAGTTTLASIFSDNNAGPTPKANPFTAQLNGYFFFYAANGHYDVTFSGGGLAAPLTFGDVLLADPTAGPTSVTSVTTSGPGISVAPNTGAVVISNTGVTSLTGGPGITVTPAGGTGAVTVTNPWGALPAGLPTQYLRLKPNVGNNTTLEFADLYVQSKDYDFPAQTPGGSLAAGNNAITFTPVPPGVSGSDTQHYLYIDNGTGAPEAVLITGGSGQGGDPTGQIIVNCANSHSGAWRIRSASAGIKEACNVLNNVGTINLPRATLNIYGPLVVPTTINLIGQGTSNVAGQPGSILNWLGGAGKPCMVLASGTYDSMSFQYGMGVYRDFTLYSPNNNGDGLWIGGDLSGVITPAAWSGSYTNSEYVRVINFANALVFNNANFVTFTNSVFSGLTRAFLVPAAAHGLQYVNFVSSVLTVPNGIGVQMDASDSGSGQIIYLGGQVSGTISGTSVHWHSFGTHYEPNDNGAIVSINNQSAVFFAYGGIMGTHNIQSGPGSQLIFRAGIGAIWALLDTISFSDTASAPDPLILFDGSGNLTVRSLQYFPFNWPPHLYSLGASNMPDGLLIQQNRLWKTTLNAAATLAFPQGNMNYPDSGLTVVNGSTLAGSGITAVSGLLNGQYGMIITAFPQTFTAGATIGATVTTVAGIPNQWWFDGAKFWINT